jgi:hypothetical protein
MQFGTIIKTFLSNRIYVHFCPIDKHHATTTRAQVYTKTKYGAPALCATRVSVFCGMQLVPQSKALYGSCLNGKMKSVHYSVINQTPKTALGSGDTKDALEMALLIWDRVVPWWT